MLNIIAVMRVEHFKLCFGLDNFSSIFEVSHIHFI